MDLTASLNNLGVGTSTLVIVLIINLVLIIGMLFFIARQGRQISSLEAAAKPKYGFLGKPLFSVLMIALMVGSFALTFLASQGKGDVQVGDEGQVTIEIQVDVGRAYPEGKEVTFKLIPIIDGEEWGPEGSAYKFDTFWSIIGTESFSEFEVGITREDPGGFKKIIPGGSYQVRVDLVSGTKNWTKSINVGI